MSYPPSYPPAPQPGYGQPPAPYGQPPAPAYGQPPAPYGAPAPYGQPPMPAAPPAPAAPRVGANDFLDQPAGGSGKSISGWFTTPGQRLAGQIPREITNADYQIQTDMRTKQVTPDSYYKDGRPKVNLSIPLQLINPPPEFADGRASWIVSITDYRAEILPAMEAAGVPRNADGTMPLPEKGAVLEVWYEGPKQIQGFGAPKKVKHCTYYRPEGMAPGQPAAGQGGAEAQAPAAPQAPQYQPPATPQLPTAPGAPPYPGNPPAPMAPAAYQPPAAPQYQPPQAPATQPQYAAPMPPAAPQNGAGYTAQQQAAPAPQAGPAPLPADKNALFGQLQAGQAQTPPAPTS